MTGRIVVIGAGLMGLTTAYWLNRAGASVHVVDAAAGPGLGASFANGGMLTPSQANPWNAPGIATYAARTIGAADSPFLIRPAALPGLLRWGARFLLQSRRGAYARNARRNLALGMYSLAQHRRILAETGIDCAQRQSGTLQVFRDEPSLTEAWKTAALLQKEGLAVERLSSAALLDKVPALTQSRWTPHGGLFFPEDESGDARLFCEGLARHLSEAGVEFSYDTPLETLEHRGDRLLAIGGPKGRVMGDAFVVAIATGAPALLRRLRLDIPIYPVKGYSITVDSTLESPALGLPVVDVSRKVAVTPMEGRLRIAGSAEFNGFDDRIEPARAAMLLRDATALLPSLERADRDRMQIWTGLRPVTPTGFPVLGRRGANLFVNAGHGALGWTFAAGSGRIVADLVLGARHGLQDNPLVQSAIAA